MGFRIAIDQLTSRRLIYVLFAIQACVVGGISYQHRHGNPLRMGVDEHGVLRFQSMREYLSDEIKVCCALISCCGQQGNSNLIAVRGATTS
jgi:hypothetical protein